MGSRIKSLFGLSPSSNSRLRAQPYDTSVALDPPVKGSYPVAGNGPAVLESIQRSRATKERRRLPAPIASVADAPTVPRRREDVAARPGTAPHSEFGGGASEPSSASSRTRSGFSIKSPPALFSNRLSGPNVESPPLVSPAADEVKATHENIHGFPPHLAQHNRNSSHGSRKAHVDLLDAHSNINGSKEVSQHRAKASGVRNYGEDVADRNIADFGDQRLDLSSPDLSYLKSVYASSRQHVASQGSGEVGMHSRATSAFGHVFGNVAAEDNQTPLQASRSKSQPVAQEARLSTAGPRDGATHPPRTYSTSVYGSQTGFDKNLAPSDLNGLALSPLSAPPTSIYQPRPRDMDGQPMDYGRTVPTPPIPARARQRPGSPEVATREQPSTLPRNFSQSNPTSPSQSRRSAAVPSSGPTPTKTKARQRAMSTTSENSPTASGTTKSRAGSVSYSPFPSTSRRGSQASEYTSDPIVRQNTLGGVNKRAGIFGTPEAMSIESIINSKKRVETDVNTKRLPAYLHDHLKPKLHDSNKETTNLGINYLDGFHPNHVAATEIVPQNSYISSKEVDGLVKIPENSVPSGTARSRPRTAHTIEVDAAPSGRDGNSRPSTDYALDGPVIGLARGEASARKRGNSWPSTKSRVKRMSAEPLPSSRKETIPGTAKTDRNRRQYSKLESSMPGAWLEELSGESQDYSEDDVETAASRKLAKGEEELLFRDSGYGSGGMLPGLLERSPLITTFPDPVNVDVRDQAEDRTQSAETGSISTLRLMKDRRLSVDGRPRLGDAENAD